MWRTVPFAATRSAGAVPDASVGPNRPIVAVAAVAPAGTESGTRPDQRSGNPSSPCGNHTDRGAARLVGEVHEGADVIQIDRESGKLRRGRLAGGEGNVRDFVPCGVENREASHNIGNAIADDRERDSTLLVGDAAVDVFSDAAGIERYFLKGKRLSGYGSGDPGSEQDRDTSRFLLDQSYPDSITSRRSWQRLSNPFCDCVHQFGYHLILLFRGAVTKVFHNARLDVALENRLAHFGKGCPNRGDLIDDLHAVALLLDHLLDTPDLAFHAAHSLQRVEIYPTGTVAPGVPGSLEFFSHVSTSTESNIWFHPHPQGVLDHPRCNAAYYTKRDTR